MYIRKPSNRGGQWTVQIAESRSPLAKVTEEFKSSCYASAYKIYQRLMREAGNVETWDVTRTWRKAHGFPMEGEE